MSLGIHLNDSISALSTYRNYIENQQTRPYFFVANEGRNLTITSNFLEKSSLKVVIAFIDKLALEIIARGSLKETKLFYRLIKDLTFSEYDSEKNNREISNFEQILGVLKEETFSLLELLNDDILFQLTQYLKLDERANLKKTSSVFNEFLNKRKSCIKLKNASCEAEKYQVSQYLQAQSKFFVKQLDASEASSYFSDYHFSYILSLGSLKSLNLSSCIKISALSLKHLRLLSNLTHLDLSGSPLKDEDGYFLASLNQLKELKLHRAHKLKGDVLKYLEPLYHLRSLTLSNCPSFKKINFSYLPFLQTLKALDLSNSVIDDQGLCYLSSLISLESLILDGSVHFTDRGFVELASLKELQVLNVAFCKGLTNNIANIISSFTNLQDLILKDIAITDEGLLCISNCQQLRRIDLTNSLITDEGISYLLPLSQLQELDLSLTGITDAGLEVLTYLENLKVLHLVCCEEITDQGLYYLTNYQKLNILSITQTPLITQTGISYIDSASQISYVFWGQF
jgi:hypothetical protein